METTLVPFSTLPACAQSCGPLYDANGACAPAGTTKAASVYASCFCANPSVTAFSTGTAGVCDSACAADPDGFNSIRNWFTAFCANPATITGAPVQGGGGGGSQTTSTSSKFTNFAAQGPTGDWISTHWQWVVMLVVIVVGIAGIWVGACIWRRRYLRKKDRQYALGKRLGGGVGVGTTASNPNLGNASQRSVHIPSAGMFEPAPISAAGIYGPETEREKRDRKKWNLSERT